MSDTNAYAGVYYIRVDFGSVQSGEIPFELVDVTEDMLDLDDGSDTHELEETYAYDVIVEDDGNRLFHLSEDPDYLVAALERHRIKLDLQEMLLSVVGRFNPESYDGIFYIDVEAVTDSSGVRHSKLVDLTKEALELDEHELLGLKDAFRHKVVIDFGGRWLFYTIFPYYTLMQSIGSQDEDEFHRKLLDTVGKSSS